MFGPHFTPAMAAAGMAVCLTRRAERSVCYGFSVTPGGNPFSGSDCMVPLPLTRRTSAAAAAAAARAMTFGGTDCAAPMIHAAEENIPVDCFVVLTDCETWAGEVHPADALKAYRRKTGIPARLVVAAFVSNGFSIADPQDAGMLDVAGFDLSVPELVERFAAGGL